MNKIVYLLIFVVFLSSCSNKNSKLWPLSKKKNDLNLIEENKESLEQIFKEEEIVNKEFNQDLIFKISQNEKLNNLVKDVKNKKKIKFKKIKKI